MFYKNNKESCPQEIWIRICFLEINGSPSLVEIYHGLIPRKKTMKKANNTKTGSILRILDHLDFIL